MNNTTVAIVGTHTDTRELAPFQNPSIDIWVFNEVAGQIRKQEDGSRRSWAWRVNGVFQMHQPAIYRSKHNRSDPHHWEWLQKAHKFPIWMLEQDVDVPQCEMYPLDELCDALLSKFRQGNPPEERRYFTSTIGYAIALAIYKGYENIEIYGIEMSSATEYTYQRDCVAAWTFYALGRGIAVTHYGGDAIYDRPLYGYEGAIEIPPEEYAERQEFLQEQHRKALTAVHNAELALDQHWGDGELLKYVAQVREAQSQKGFFEGALAETEKYLFKVKAMREADDGGYIDRNEFEGAYASQVDEIENWGSGVNQTIGVLNMMTQSYIASGNPEVLEKMKQVRDEHFKCAHKSGYHQGIYEENKRLAILWDKLVTAAGGSKAIEYQTQTANGTDS